MLTVDSFREPEREEVRGADFCASARHEALTRACQPPHGRASANPAVRFVATEARNNPAIVDCKVTLELQQLRSSSCHHTTAAAAVIIIAAAGTCAGVEATAAAAEAAVMPPPPAAIVMLLNLQKLTTFTDMCLYVYVSPCICLYAYIFAHV